MDTKQIVEIKANAKASQLILYHKRHPQHFNLLKAVITKIGSMSGVETAVPSDYKNVQSE